ncbi:uncharacterized protein LOC128398151 isoform X1 [Panonychus citri]|uniref:uncharacterized protein LOC128398151 isoform X1 n=1 Tax=Panonychus citri TaxID=50023 RepID=UPI0023071EF8|nr:uncharacterized protein LOC128398151 isoform X1 [Panonychus citri]
MMSICGKTPKIIKTEEGSGNSTNCDVDGSINCDIGIKSERKSSTFLILDRSLNGSKIDRELETVSVMKNSTNKSHGINKKSVFQLKKKISNQNLQPRLVKSNKTPKSNSVQRGSFQSSLIQRSSSSSSSTRSPDHRKQESDDSCNLDHKSAIGVSIKVESISNNLEPDCSTNYRNSVQSTSSCSYLTSSTRARIKNETELPISSSSLQTQPSSTLNLNVYHHIIDTKSTQINMINEKRMKQLALNSMEETRLIELTLAYGALDEPSACPLTTKDNLLLIIDYYNGLVDYLLLMAQKLSKFVELPVEDKNRLVQGTLVDILSMRSTFAFDLDNLLWMVKGKGMTVKLEDIIQFDTSYHEDYLEFVKSFDPLWKKNIIINQLIVAIMLFKYDLPNLQSHETIRLEYCTYVYLLERYLESSLNFSDQPREMLFNILDKISRLQLIAGNSFRLTIKGQPRKDAIIGRAVSILTPD